MIVETKNRKLRILVRIKMNFVGFLHIHCKPFPGSIRIQTSQTFLQLDWVTSCQGQVTSIKRVRYSQALSACSSTHKATPAKLIIHIIDEMG